jgi:hypothetical protein
MRSIRASRRMEHYCSWFETRSFSLALLTKRLAALLNSSLPGLTRQSMRTRNTPPSFSMDHRVSHPQPRKSAGGRASRDEPAGSQNS